MGRRFDAIFILICAGCITAAAHAYPDRPAAAWNAEKAGHLLRRAGFGGTPEQVRELASLTRTKAVELLLDPPRPAPADSPVGVERLEPIDRQEMRLKSDEERQQLRQERNQTEQMQLQLLRRWWVRRMVESPRALDEKMTLFWHGHFTSGAREVRGTYMLYEQNQLFRRYATGNFRTLLLEVSRNPAMLLYLNSAQNNKDHPNENYARELMELFTLGIGHYSEGDIREAARAFTGWSLDRGTGDFLFRPGMHDYGRKTVLGVSGNLNGGDVIDILLAQPRAGEYLCGKLWRFFAGTEAPPRVVRSLAATFRQNNYEIRPVLRAMFNHPAFYTPEVMHARVKSPVELLVGAARQLEIDVVDYDALVLALRGMGQDLFQPPNVKGWDGGLKWINTATLYTRCNATGRLISGTSDLPGRRAMMAGPRRDVAMRMNVGATAPQPAFDPLAIVRREKLRTAPQLVDHFVDRLLGRPLADERRKVLLDLLDESLQVRDDLAAEANESAVRELILLLVALPEYQLS